MLSAEQIFAAQRKYFNFTRKYLRIRKYICKYLRNLPQIFADTQMFFGFLKYGSANICKYLRDLSQIFADTKIFIFRSCGIFPSKSFFFQVNGSDKKVKNHVPTPIFTSSSALIKNMNQMNQRLFVPLMAIKHKFISKAIMYFDSKLLLKATRVEELVQK